MKIWNTTDEVTANYAVRTEARQEKLLKATMSLVGYFMGLGDSLTDANAKVSQVSTEVAPFVYIYTLGNYQPLFDGINASALVFMDAEAKNTLITALTF